MKYIRMKQSSRGSLLVDHIHDGKLHVDNMAWAVRTHAIWKIFALHVVINS